MRLVFPALTFMIIYLVTPAQLYAGSNLDGGGMSPERKHEMCNVYSNDAGRKAQEAQRLRCGFSGPVWTGFSKASGAHFPAEPYVKKHFVCLLCNLTVLK